MAGKKINILTKEQINFLNFFARQKYFVKNYYLTGGTPLAVFYLQHRYSEDLDFFTEKQEVDIMAVQQFIALVKHKLKLTKVSYKQYYGLHTFFLTYPNKEELKIDFNYYPFRQLDSSRQEMGVAVDSLKDIAINKVQSIATRTNARDFVDLYFIFKQERYNIRELWQLARMKFDWYIDPIQLGKQLLKAQELKDYPRMIKKYKQADFNNFFKAQAQEMGKEVMNG
jgi:predicted nucleotidyltransferase component of viral defense system